MEPFFSLIIPVYNCEKYIHECIDSIISQTFSNWELILVDDGSTDNSGDICQNYCESDNRIKYIKQENGGASKARNTGLDNAYGEFIIFIDSDDYYGSKDALCLVKKCIDDHNSDVVVFGCTDFNMITGVEFVSRSNYNFDVISKENKNDTLHYLLSNKLIPGAPWLFAFSREIVHNNNIKFKLGIQDEDYDFVLSVFYFSSSIYAIDEPFYMYRNGRPDSVTGSGNIKMIYGIDYTIEKWYKLCKNIENQQIVVDILNYLAFIFTTGFVISGRMDSPHLNEAKLLMKKHDYILNYGYWKKTKIIKVFYKLLGFDFFSKLSAIYFDKTHKHSKNKGHK